MPHTNSYTPPDAVSLETNRNTSAEEYDHHFFWPVETLSSDRLQLRPFVVRSDSDRPFENPINPSHPSTPNS